MEQWVNQFSGKRLLVLGDLMLDRFVSGTVERISPEAPVPVVRVSDERETPGGAANVAMLAAALGARVSFAGVCGADRAAEQTIKLLEAGGVDCSLLCCSAERTTPVKTRITAQRQQLLRIDREEPEPLGERWAVQLLERLLPQLDRFDAVIFSDYNKGCAVEQLTLPLFAAARRGGLLCAVDPKPVNFPLYRGVDLLTPNTAETGTAAGFTVTGQVELERAAKLLLDDPAPRLLLVTRSEHGMALFRRETAAVYLPVEAQEVYDVTGAGDMVITAATLALLCGAPAEQAARLANLAAGLEVRHFGCVPVSAAELLTAVRRREEQS